MIVRFGLLQKNPSWSDERFAHHWLDDHGPLARKIPNLRAYRQNHVVDKRQLGISHQRGSWQFDGFSQLWFDDHQKMRLGMASEVAPKLVNDEGQFLGNMHIIAAESNTVIEPPAEQGAVLKRMSILTRTSGTSDARFRHEWYDVHADLVMKIPGVRGYRQNLVTVREREKGVFSEREDLPIDGMVELWFDSVASIEAGFASPAGQAAQAHGRTFLAEVTTFLVKEHVIL